MSHESVVEICFTAVMFMVVLSLILFHGEPDIVNAIIFYLMKGR